MLKVLVSIFCRYKCIITMIIIISPIAASNRHKLMATKIIKTQQYFKVKKGLMTSLDVLAT